MGKVIKIFLAVVLAASFSYKAQAGTLLTEYATDFQLQDILYSSKLTVSDFNADGKDDIIITDDIGSFHIFSLLDGSFEELWISDPLDVSMGSIKWIGCIEGPVRGSRIYVLDSSNQLHKYSYSGYIFGKTAEWHLPIEGNLIGAAVMIPSGSEEDEFLRLSILPGFKFVVETFTLGSEAVPVLKSGIGTRLYALPGFVTSVDGWMNALMTLRGDEETDGAGTDYRLEMITSAGTKLTSYNMDGFDPELESISMVGLEADGTLVAFGYGRPDKTGALQMRLWREDEGTTLTPGSWSRYPAHRAIASGDIDGDGCLEFVTVGIDGTVRVLGEEKLGYIFDGHALKPTHPSVIEPGEVFQTADLFKQLGIEIVESADKLTFSSKGLELAFTKEDGKWLPPDGNGPELEILRDAYQTIRYPLSRICIALGFAYRYRSDSNLVEVLS